MKRIILFSLLLGNFLFAAEKSISLESLLNEMVDRSTLCRTPSPAYTAKSASSYDRESKVNDPADGFYVEKDGRDWGKGWFANRDFAHFIREEINDGRKEAVMMEDIGPGAIVRWWQPSELKRVRWSPSTGRDIIRVYIDGSSTPVIEARPDELIGGSLLAPYPFSFMASNDEIEIKWRGRNLYLPIPYAKSCKVTWEGTPFYYQIGYRSYAPGTKVESFSMEQLEDAKETLTRVTETLTAENTNAGGEKIARTDVVLAPEESTSLTLSEPGAITKLLVQLSADDYRQALRSTVISMEFDGQRTAWLPVGALGGVGYSAEKNDTFYIKTDPDTGTISSSYVMPFQKTAVITLTNHGEQDVTVKQFELTADEYQWDDRSLYFHATWFEQRNISTQNRSDLNYVTVNGAGRYVGTSITVFDACTAEGTWWGEGDDKVYVDGETFPSIFGTGTEDYFGYAWCKPQRFNTPFISQPRGEGNNKPGYTNNNRYHLLDDIPFTQSLQFDMEIWHAFRGNMNYAAATFFYARPGSSHNIEPDVDAVRHKVALHIDDVISVNNCGPCTVSDSSPLTFNEDVEFLKKHTDVVMLRDGDRQVAVVPQYQGRVMTSTASAESGSSYGWLNYELIKKGLLPKTETQGTLEDHIYVFGGEERFWMGPEGGQFSIFFKPGVEFDFANWKTPASIDTQPYSIADQARDRIVFTHDCVLTNYSGTELSVGIDRIKQAF